MLSTVHGGRPEAGALTADADDERPRQQHGDPGREQRLHRREVLHRSGVAQGDEDELVAHRAPDSEEGRDQNRKILDERTPPMSPRGTMARPT